MLKTRNVTLIVRSCEKIRSIACWPTCSWSASGSGLKLSILEIGQLSIYNQDGDDKPPMEWATFGGLRAFVRINRRNSAGNQKSGVRD